MKEQLCKIRRFILYKVSPAVYLGFSKPVWSLRTTKNCNCFIIVHKSNFRKLNTAVSSNWINGITWRTDRSARQSHEHGLDQTGQSIWTMTNNSTLQKATFPRKIPWRNCQLFKTKVTKTHNKNQEGNDFIALCNEKELNSSSYVPITLNNEKFR